MFQETLVLSSSTIVAHSNLVKRVVFPLETLPIAQALSGLGNQMFGTLALLVATIIIRHELHLTTLWLPVLLIPQLIATLGAAWLIASLGVFLRDIAQGISLFLMAWMYLTPIIYPESIVPARYRFYVDINPFTALIRSYRRILDRRLRSRLARPRLLHRVCDWSVLFSATGGSPRRARISRM